MADVDEHHREHGAVRAEQARRALGVGCDACGAKPGSPCFLIESGLVLDVPLRYPHRDRLPPYAEVREALRG